MAAYMAATQDLSRNFKAIVDIARLSPSVHNTQPFKVSQSGESIKIALDTRYLLNDGDPTGRQSIISLGIFTEAICIAADELGFELAKLDFNEDSATVAFKPGKSATGHKQSELLGKRCTDRSIYQPVAITPQIRAALEGASSDSAVTVRVVTDQPLISTIATLTSKGIRLALTSPGFRKELSQYLVLPWSNKKRGIAVKSLYIPLFLELLEPLLMRLGIGLNAEAALEKKRWLSASGVVIILTDGDMPHYWFSAGQAYLRASLAIEANGLSQATSAAVVEASNFHEDIEDLLGTRQRIQCMVRIGRGSRKRYRSPRVSGGELITT